MLQSFPDTLNLETNIWKVEYNLQTSHQSTVEKENILTYYMNTQQFFNTVTRMLYIEYSSFWTARWRFVSKAEPCSYRSKIHVVFHDLYIC